VTTVDSTRPSFREIVRDFNPAWFAAVMGTAVVPLAISFVEASWVDLVAAVFIVLSVILFVVILVPWTLRLFLFPDAVRHDLHHPIAASFFPTMPIAVMVIALDFLKYPDLLFSSSTSENVAFWLWLVGAVGIYVAGFVVLPRIYQSDTIELSHANFGWFIPPVANLLIPVGGLELARVFPDRFEVTFLLSMVSLGIGLVLFVYVGALVYQRYVLEALPPNRFAATSFIAMAPTAIISVALFKLMQLFEAGTPLDLSTEAVKAFSVLGILVSWGFSAWAFVMAVVIVLSYLRNLGLPYALSWWAYTFPVGALAVSTGVVWNVTGFASVRWFYVGVVVVLFGVWTTVATQTAIALWTGKVLQSPHQPPAKAIAGASAGFDDHHE
jgi:C4-dicarboxylate transporter/malic acid transport protein